MHLPQYAHHCTAFQGRASTLKVSSTGPCQHVQSLKFLVVNCLSVYNVIIGRPNLDAIRVVTSTYHLLVKFPSIGGIGGIGVLKGQQHESRHLYAIAMKQALEHATAERIQIITDGQSSQVEQVITDKIIISYFMEGVGPKRAQQSAAQRASPGFDRSAAFR